MSLQTANKKQLIAVAEWFGVSLHDAASNDAKVAAIQEKGITMKDIENLDLDKAAVFFASDITDSKSELDSLVILTGDGVDMPQYEKYVASDQAEEVKEEEKVTTITTNDLQAAEDEQAAYWREKYEALSAAQNVAKTEAAAAPSVADGQVLLVMTRANPTFEAAGIRFTKANPYALVPADKADYICRKFVGFRPAYPSEAREYYS